MGRAFICVLSEHNYRALGHFLAISFFTKLASFVSRSAHVSMMFKEQRSESVHV